MPPIREEEARYQAIQLVKLHPRLSNLLFKLQSEGAGWVEIWTLLQQAVAENPDDNPVFPPPCDQLSPALSGVHEAARLTHPT
jgi:hypothetical protein